MNTWPRRIGALLGMGSICAAAWSAVGALILTVDRSRTVDELWLGPPIGMAPGFLGGVLFTVLLWMIASRRHHDAPPLSTVVACGATAGLLVGALPFVINSPTSAAPSWLVGVVVIGSMMLLSAISAAGSLAVARTMTIVSR
jgi:hypothetical protein